MSDSPCNARDGGGRGNHGRAQRSVGTRKRVARAMSQCARGPWVGDQGCGLSHGLWAAHVAPTTKPQLHGLCVHTTASLANAGHASPRRRPSQHRAADTLSHWVTLSASHAVGNSRTPQRGRVAAFRIVLCASLIADQQPFSHPATAAHNRHGTRPVTGTRQKLPSAALACHSPPHSSTKKERRHVHPPTPSCSRACCPTLTQPLILHTLSLM